MRGVRVLFDGPGTLVVSMVSLFPTANAARGEAEGHLNPWPFRQDLLEALKALQPRFLRFPGGCYVERDWLRAAFRWKTTTGHNEERPGHHNSMWGYWSTDGLGLFEYLVLAEELGAQPIWVVNNGVWAALGPTQSQLPPLLLEELLGVFRRHQVRLPPHPPHRQLPPGGPGAHRDVGVPHVHQPARHVWTPDCIRRHDPGSKRPGVSSEFAVTDGGGQGNLIAAVAEAGFMLGMERNSEVVVAGAYAPLLVNDNARPWPTNLIVFGNHRHFGIPSYHVQQMLANHLGTMYINTAVAPGGGDTLAARASCLNEMCDKVAVKLVNFGPSRQFITLHFAGLASGALGASGGLLYLTSQHPQDENSFDAPNKVAPRTRNITGIYDHFVLPLEAWSVNILKLNIVPPAAKK